VTLADENASVVNRFSQTQFENLGLQATLQKVFNLQAEHVIELHASLFQHTNAHQATEKGVTCKRQIDSLIKTAIVNQTNITIMKLIHSVLAHVKLDIRSQPRSVR
jgi:hypothetical protein